MPPSPDRAFWKSIQSGSFPSVYYLYGDDDFLKEHAVRQLIASAVDPATRDFNLDVRNASELDAETLSSLVGTPPMMAERRVVVVRDVAALKKDARAALDRHLERTARSAPHVADIVLVLVALGGEKVKPDRALEQAGLAVEFQPLTGDRVPKWITHHVSTELGGSITPTAAELLQSAVGSDLPALAAELDKLVSYTGGAQVGEDAVSAVVGVRRGETLGDLLDRVADRDAAGALALLGHVLEQPKTTGVSIVMALTTQMLALAWGEVLRRERGTSPARLESEFFSLLRSAGGAYTGRPWGDAVKAWAKHVDRWDAESLDAALASLLVADVALKETRVSSDEQLLTTLVLALCVGDPRTTPVASHRMRGVAV